MVDPIKVSFSVGDALPLTGPEKSAGKSKTRVQVLGLDDTIKEFAIAILPSKDKPHAQPKFTIMDKLRGVVLLKVQGNGESDSYYIKVNASSLRKRFGITKDEFSTAVKTGGGDVTELVSAKIQERLIPKAASKVLEGTTTDGYNYFKDKICPKDKKPIEYMQEIVDGKVPFSKATQGAVNFLLGQCYRYGVEVKSDGVKAFDYFIKGADQGDANAMNALGLCIEQGVGKKADDK